MSTMPHTNVQFRQQSYSEKNGGGVCASSHSHVYHNYGPERFTNIQITPFGIILFVYGSDIKKSLFSLFQRYRLYR